MRFRQFILSALILGVLFPLAALFIVPAAQAQSLQAQSPQNPSFSLPIACLPGQDCFIQNYVDRDTSSNAGDYACGPRTYDQHTGTDIRIPDLSSMRGGVAVLAAADGTVWRTRDEMDDVNVNVIGRDAVKGRDGGNAVIINHPGGWQTIYAHMRRGSVVVKPGDIVKKGDKLGLVGLSGLTEFPHLHFEVRHNGAVIDPFTGQTIETACQSGLTKPAQASLWDAALLTGQSLAYRRGEVIALGFASEKPDNAKILDGAYKPTPLAGDDAAYFIVADRPALVFWVVFAGLEKDDVIILSLQGPDGSTLAESRTVLDRPKAQWIGFVGIPNKSKNFTAGSYWGVARVERANSNGKPAIEARQTALVVAP